MFFLTNVGEYYFTSPFYRHTITGLGSICSQFESHRLECDSWWYTYEVYHEPLTYKSTTTNPNPQPQRTQIYILQSLQHLGYVLLFSPLIIAIIFSLLELGTAFFLETNTAFLKVKPHINLHDLCELIISDYNEQSNIFQHYLKVTGCSGITNSNNNKKDNLEVTLLIMQVHLFFIFYIL